jgi:hypothetical protein
MSVAAVLLPLLVEVGLTFALLLRLGSVRARAVREGQVRLDEIALGEKAWPGPVLQVSNAFDNQFQLPVLFYALTALVLVTGTAGTVFVVLAWIFVLSRLVHAAIHIGSNVVMLRFRAYLVGVVVLVAMWTLFAVEILFGL